MADTLDVVTLAEAKTALGLKPSGTNHDTDLAQYITAVSRRLDQLCGGVVTRTVTSERHDGGREAIRLRHPVTSFTSVIEYQGTSSVTLTAETAGTTPDGYYAEPHRPDPTLSSGRLIRRSGGCDRDFWPGRGNIVVSYAGGRYGSTAAVDARFKDAAYLMLRNLWAATEPSLATMDEFDTPGSRFPTFAVPKAVLELLRDEIREIPGVG